MVEVLLEADSPSTSSRSMTHVTQRHMTEYCYLIPPFSFATFAYYMLSNGHLWPLTSLITYPNNNKFGIQLDYSLKKIIK